MEQIREGDCEGEKWANILNWVKCEWHTHLIFLMESKQMMMTLCCTVDVWNYQKLGIIFRFALIQILFIQLIPARKKRHNGKGLAWFADVTGIAFRAVIYLFILLLFLTILLSFLSNFPSSAQWKHCAGKSTPANKRPLALFWGLFFVFPCKWTFTNGLQPLSHIPWFSQWLKLKDSKCSKKLNNGNSMTGTELTSYVFLSVYKLF